MGQQGKMRKVLVSFYKKFKGKRINGYTRNGGQCIDAWREFVKMLTGDPYYGCPRVAGAEDIWNALDPKKWIKVRNTSKNFPLMGAIVICKRGRWGHVLFADDGCTATELRGIAQNWTLEHRVAKEEHDTYAEMEVIGWAYLR